MLDVNGPALYFDIIIFFIFSPQTSLLGLENTLTASLQRGKNPTNKHPAYDINLVMKLQ